jgi:aspartate/methionine/tyrosine aminotransferase
MNPLATELNQVVQAENPYIMEMLASVGKQLFFPKGILSQGAEAKQKAHKLNATIGIATQADDIMYFDSVMTSIKNIPARESLTYAPSFGIPDLRKAWKDSLYVKNPSLKDKPISLPVVTSGITHGVSMFADLWVDPGDVVILPEMMWGNYNMIFNVRKGARIRTYETFTSAGGYNIEALRDAVTDEAQKNKKIAVLLNFPHNPSGYTATDAEGDQIVSILTKAAQSGTHVMAVCDDSYFGLFYEPEALQESLFAKLCGQDPKLLAVKLDGGTKENFVWGLRVGFITYGIAADNPGLVYEALEKKTAGCIRGNISNASHLGQSIVLKSMQSEAYPHEKQEKFEILKQRAATVKAVLADEKYQHAWEAFPFNSGYFMCIRLKTVDAEKLRVHLLNTYGVGLISIGTDKLRVAFSCLEDSDIQTLFDTILKGVEELQADS